MDDGARAALDRLRGSERRVALATLVSTSGRAPLPSGATMWVGEGGRILGSVTIGGCVDARVLDAAAGVLATDAPVLLTIALGDEDAWDLGMTCAGTVRVLVEPLDLDRGDDPVCAALEVLDAELRAGRRAVSVAALDGGVARLVVREDGSTSGSLGAPALDRAGVARARALLADGVPRGTTYSLPTAEGEREYFAELHAPPATLVVVGATHVAMPLVAMARTLGFRTVVIDVRERFATRERFPEADELRIGAPGELVESMRLGRSSFVVLVAHDYKHELPVLRAVLASEAAYIGMLGSARRGRAVLDFLAGEGIAAEALARVHVPVGLDIGAVSAPEIALSILAELIAVRAGRPGTPMRARASVPNAMQGVAR